MTADTTPDGIDLDEYDLEETVLTRRQAEVLALRDQGLTQADIADRFGTSRANVANIEASARENARKARKTVEFLETLHSPVQVDVEAFTSLFDVPSKVYTACDAADVKVDCSAVELVQQVREDAADAIRNNVVDRPLRVVVTEAGGVRIFVQDGTGTDG